MGSICVKTSSSVVLRGQKMISVAAAAASSPASVPGAIAGWQAANVPTAITTDNCRKDRRLIELLMYISFEFQHTLIAFLWILRKSTCMTTTPEPYGDFIVVQ